MPTDLVPYLGKYLIEREFVATFKDPDLPCIVELHVQVRDGAPEVTQLIATQKKGGDWVDGKVIRAIPVHELLTEAIRQRTRESERRKGNPLAKPPKVVHAPRTDGNRHQMTDELLQEVADVYRSAEPFGKPIEYVADHFSRPGDRVAKNTVRRWVMIARQRGFLEESKRSQTLAQRTAKNGRKP